MSSAREIELKFEISASDVPALEGHSLLAPLPCDRKRQTSIYFDTPEGKLRKAGISLRVRESDGRYLQTVKRDGGDGATGGGLFDRSECETPVETNAPDLGKAGGSLNGKLAKKAVREAIGPRFETIVDRSTWLISKEGSEVELVLDRGEVAAQTASAPIREVELELLSGPAIRLFELARQLNASVPLRLGFLTKSERGYRLLDGIKPGIAKAEPIILSPDHTVGEGFRAIALACIRHFRLNEALLVDEREGAALHQMRVALRRLRSAFSLFKAAIADAERDRLREELRWISGALGKARDLDVFVQKRLDPDETSPELWSQVVAQREAAFDEAIEAVNSERSRALMIALVQWTTLGGWRAAGDDVAKLRDRPLAAFASDALDRFHRKVVKGGRKLARLGDEERHAVRIAGKKLRYASEFFASLYDGRKHRALHKKYVQSLEALQEELGSLNDQVTARKLSEQIAASLTSENARNELLAREAIGQKGEKPALMRRGVDAYDRFEKAEPFW